MNTLAITQSSVESVSRTHSLIIASKIKNTPQRRLSVLQPVSVIANTPLNIYLNNGFFLQTEIRITTPKIPSNNVSLRINILGILINNEVPPNNKTDPEEISAKIGV